MTLRLRITGNRWAWNYSVAVLKTLYKAVASILPLKDTVTETGSGKYFATIICLIYQQLEKLPIQYWQLQFIDATMFANQYDALREPTLLYQRVRWRPTAIGRLHSSKHSQVRWSGQGVQQTRATASRYALHGR